ncbi:MAG: EAL domain-containing protein [Proteobacteria bacterium]|nr:EAL domain-containing protein [Pseudomonadota bacterium]
MQTTSARQGEFPSTWVVGLLRTAFPALPTEIPPAVVALAARRRAAPGEVVCTPDQPVSALTIVVSGSLRLEKDGHTIRDFGPGNYFGEGSLIRGAAPSVTITVTEPTELLEFPRDALRAVMEEQPAFSLTLMQALLTETMSRLQATNQLFADNRSLAQQLSQTVSMLDGARGQVQDSEERMRFLASHDPLTQLGNRSLLHDRLEAALTHAKRSGKRFALHMVDLDNFKEINDLHGHHTGDKVLTMVAERIGKITRSVDTIARLGGDEFSVLQDMTDRDNAENAGALAERLVNGLASPMQVQSLELHCGASVGVALYPDDGNAPDDLLRHADLALDRAKTEGRGRYTFFTPALGEQAMRNAVVKASLRQAIADRQLSVFYQPKADMRSGEIVGAEALVRWQHPQHGMIPPTEFIPVAERSGMIGALGEFVLHEACLQTARWRQNGMRGFTIAVNLSPVQFRVQDVKALVEDALKSTNLPPEALELEVTETTLMQDADDTKRALRSLQDQGVSVAVDDFGTGYSSLAYLKQLAAKTLKIDRSFVDGCAEQSEDQQIVRAIIDLAHNLGMKVVAEGIETPEQVNVLQRMRCDSAQGYLIAKPLSTVDLDKFLNQHSLTEKRVAVSLF